ncbi:MAG: hypothetical protein M5U28_40590 [Sandaracinaceae bacterium]|nr:hypothetical protein [Sandaracinaceae bacterium]
MAWVCAAAAAIVLANSGVGYALTMQWVRAPYSCEGCCRATMVAHGTALTRAVVAQLVPAALPPLLACVTLALRRRG